MGLFGLELSKACSHPNEEHHRDKRSAIHRRYAIKWLIVAAIGHSSTLHSYLTTLPKTLKSTVTIEAIVFFEGFMRQMTIGRLSKAAGVKVTTIHYYESIDLMGEPERSTSGQRMYGDDAVQRLSFVRHARDLGFPIDSIRELIKLQEQPGENCSNVDVIARHQLADVRQKLSQLGALEAELKRMVSACEGGSIATCKVLESLSDHEHCLDAHEGAAATTRLGERW